jgi:hypothetical protein
VRGGEGVRGGPGVFGLVSHVPCGVEGRGPRPMPMAKCGSFGGRQARIGCTF